MKWHLSGSTLHTVHSLPKVQLQKLEQLEQDWKMFRVISEEARIACKADNRALNSAPLLEPLGHKGS